MISKNKKRLFALILIVFSNSLILGIAALLRRSVVDSWKKGPLIDPAAPYAPENAQWFFAISMCAILNLYFLLLVIAPKFREKIWYPILALFLSIAVTEIGLSQYLQ